MIKVYVNYDNYFVRPFTNVDPDQTGLEVFDREKKYIGQTEVYDHIPDEEDEDYGEFLDAIDAVILENE